MWEPSRLVVVGDRKLEDSHTRDATRTSLWGVGKARHRLVLTGGTKRGGPRQTCKNDGYTIVDSFFEPNDEHTIANIERSRTQHDGQGENGREEIKHLWLPLALYTPLQYGD